QRLAKVTGVGCEHDLAVIKPQLQRLVPCGVAIRRQADHRTVTEHIVLAINQSKLVAEGEVAWIIAMASGGGGIHSRIPLPMLYQHCRVRDQCIAANVVEVKMRIDQQIDLAGVAAYRRKPRADLLTRRKGDAKQRCETVAKPSGWIVLAIGM